MSGKSLYFENAHLRSIFYGDSIEGLTQNAPVETRLDDLVVALHTLDPGDDGEQTTNEVVYDGYARQLGERGEEIFWIVSGSSAFPIDPIVFPENLGTAPDPITFASIGDGNNRILYSGPVYPVILVPTGVSPILKGFSDTPPSHVTED